MSKDNCDSLAEKAALEPNFVKRGIVYNKASQCYKKNNELDKYKLMKEKAIEAFQSESKRIKDPYEKALIISYEASCWICLERFENAKTILKSAKTLFSLYRTSKTPTPNPILDFTDFLASKELEKAENLWKNIHQNFSEGIVELLEEAFSVVNPSLEPPKLEKPLKFSKVWKISMEGSNEKQKQWSISFFDAKEIFDETIVLKPEFLDDLFEKLRENDHYHFIQNILSATSSIGEDLTSKALYIILATSKAKELKFGIMLGRLKEGGLYLIALWPEALAQAIGVDGTIFTAFLNRIIDDPEWFSDINILTVLPNNEGTREEREGLSDNSYHLPDFYT